MKLNFDRVSAKDLRLTFRTTLFVVMAFSLGVTQAVAQDFTPNSQAPNNIATLNKGSIISYSSPLKHGDSPNGLITGSSNTLAFSNHVGNTFMIVLDLGKSYDINTIKLTFGNPVKVQVFVLKNKPQPGATWSSTIAKMDPTGTLKTSGSPAYFNGSTGEYLVLVFNGNPGPFGGLYVTGIPTPYHEPRRNPYDDPLDTTPVPYHSFPGVPPASD